MNKNILDNPDFQHPVNQRGQTTYTATGYFIDRWRTNTHTTADNPITLVSKGLQSGKTNLDIYQSIETERIQRDQSYTVSVIVNGELCSRTIGPNEWDVNHVIREQGNVCIRLKETGKNIELDIFCGAGDLIITAAKLELGSQQTLAHKEGDTWVLNEIPNYAEELAKCQRYQQVLSGFDDSAMLGVGFANTINNAQILVSTPVSLRAIPSAKMNGETLYLVDSSSWGAGKIVTAISARRATNNTIMLNCTVQSELTVNKTYFLCTLKNTSLILDANL